MDSWQNKIRTNLWSCLSEQCNKAYLNVGVNHHWIRSDSTVICTINKNLLRIEALFNLWLMELYGFLTGRQERLNPSCIFHGSYENYSPNPFLKLLAPLLYNKYWIHHCLVNKELFMYNGVLYLLKNHQNL